MLGDPQIRTYGRVTVETIQDEETEAAVQKILTGNFGDEHTMMWRSGVEEAVLCRGNYASN